VVWDALTGAVRASFWRATVDEVRFVPKSVWAEPCSPSASCSRFGRSPRSTGPNTVKYQVTIFLRNSPPAMDFQSGMSLPTSLFEAFKHLLVSPLISPITRFFVSFPAIFLCGFPSSLTTGFLRNFTCNIIREIVVD
jgi:hypothetical protein